jgi:hypothetical protein
VLSKEPVLATMATEPSTIENKNTVAMQRIDIFLRFTEFNRKNTVTWGIVT